MRWLRPEFQHPAAGAAPEQAEMETGAEGVMVPGAAATKPQLWPKDTIEQVRVVADTLATSVVPLSAADTAARFKARGSWKKRLPPLLDMLVALGRASEADGRYRAAP